MTDEVKRIFSINLNRYINRSGKTQKEIAKELGFLPSTFNTWCTGAAFPSTGKLQALADYFNIKKSDLIEEKTKEAADADSEEFDQFWNLFKNSDEEHQKLAILALKSGQLRS